MAKTVLHVGCGPYHPGSLHRVFSNLAGPASNSRETDASSSGKWKEVRLDINPDVKPDIVASITDMKGVQDGSVEGVWSSHNLEHLFFHEVKQAVSEFFRVLKPMGCILVSVPDVQSVAQEVAKGNLETPIYQSAAGPVSAVDVLWGFRPSIQRGNHFMAHKTGFTRNTLTEKLRCAGFVRIQVYHGKYNLMACALKPGEKGQFPLFSTETQARLNEAVSAHQNGYIERAGQLYESILENHPTHADALHLYGVLLAQTGNPGQGASAILQAISICPVEPNYYDNLAVVCESLFRPDLSAQALDISIAIRPVSPETHYAMGCALIRLGQYENAVSCLKRANAQGLSTPSLFVNMGIALEKAGKPEEVKHLFEQVKHGMGDDPRVMNLLGEACRQTRDYFRAAHYFSGVLEKNPDDPRAVRNLVQQYQNLYEWENLARLAPKLDAITEKAIDSGEPVHERPFDNITRHAEPALNYLVASACAKEITEEIRKKTGGKIISFSGFPKKKNKKIHIGYVSADFGSHPVGYLTRTLFENHDREKFEVTGYSLGKAGNSPCMERIAKGCDRFVNLSGKTDMDAAYTIHHDQVDILVDLMGYTGDNRPGIFATRPAPVQVSFLGFPGTTGADFMDYLIADKTVFPEKEENFAAESLVYMPHTYQVNDRDQEISEKGFTREGENLPEEKIVFCCFNREYKIEPRIFSIWMEILKQVENSVLWLLSVSPHAERNLQNHAKKHGVSPERLVFAKALPKNEHLARHSLADLVLDTRLYTGHTSTSDALFAGVPVLALTGKHFASRVSQSLLQAIGLEDLICPTLGEYQARAIDLGTHPEKLLSIRQRLSKNRMTEPLFDTRRYCRNLEKAFEIMWERFLANAPSAKIEVTE